MVKIKTYFLILNVFFSIIAFSYLVYAATGDILLSGTTAGQGIIDSGGQLSTSSQPPPVTPIPGAGGSTLPPAGGTTPPTGSLPPTTPPIGPPAGPGVAPPPDTPPPGTTPPPGDTVPPEDDTGGGDIDDGGGIGIGNLIQFNVGSIITRAGFGASMFGTIGALGRGDNGYLWGSIAGAVGGIVSGLTESLGPVISTALGIGVAAAIFILTWKKTSKEIVEFRCLPWQAPIGGDDCQKCNNFKECSEYSCKSLGQACDIVNQGTPEQKCFWKNPSDVNSPRIQMQKVSKGYIYAPDKSIRPPATGIKITQENGKCVKAFFPLEFTFITDEPAQCKIDYNLTTQFDVMGYYVGGDSLYEYNHTEKMSLPGPDAINAVAPELKNNGEYVLFVRCRDANGNFNQDAFSISFCVEKGPDTTPPVIVDSNIPSGKAVRFNQTKLYLEVYVNEPSECKWSKEDRSYDNMENKMECDTNLWEMNNKNVYTCKTTLTGLQDRKENLYYFRCKDQPWAEEKDRNVNTQSYLYKIIGTQPLNILIIIPTGNETIFGATDTIPVFLEIETDNGYNNGESLCYYSPVRPVNEEDYILFLETGANRHKQRQDLPTGNYKYYFKCVDLGGNAAYNSTSFRVESDKTAPIVVRIYRESGELKIVTNEKSECSYSNLDCNFEIDSGIKFDSFDYESHTAEWKINQNYNIRCKDKYDNQPNPTQCSIIARPSKTTMKAEVLEFGSY